MVDLAATLIQYQEALAAKLIAPERCELSSALYVLLDDAGGKPRFTYARIIDGNAQALVAFVPVQPYEGSPCFNVGYAVDPAHRSRGMGIEVLGQALAELQNDLSRQARGAYYVEAVVAVGNEPSNRLAVRHISREPDRIVCQVSGEDAFQYLRRFPEQD